MVGEKGLEQEGRPRQELAVVGTYLREQYTVVFWINWFIAARLLRDWVSLALVGLHSSVASRMGCRNLRSHRVHFFQL